MNLGLSLSNPAFLGSMTPAASVPNPSDIPDLIMQLKHGFGRYADDGITPQNTDVGLVKRWDDQSGALISITQLTDAQALKYDAVRGFVTGCVDDITRFPMPFGLNTRAFSFFAICELSTLRKTFRYDQYFEDVHVLLASDHCYLFYRGDTGTLAVYDGSTAQGGSIYPVCNLALIGWSLDSSEVRVYCNGQTQTLSALASHTDGPGTLFSDSGNNAFQAAFKEIVAYSRAITDEEAGMLLAYAVDEYGVRVSPTVNIAFDGDSLSQCIVAEPNRGWIQQMTLPTSCQWTIVAQGGLSLSTANSERPSRVDSLIRGGMTNVLVVWLGSNDLHFNSTSGSGAYSILQTYCAGAYSAGWDKIVVVDTLPFGAFWESERQALKTLIAAGVGVDFDSLGSVASDLTIGAPGANDDEDYYFTDHVHLLPAGHAIAAPIIQAAIESVLP